MLPKRFLKLHFEFAYWFFFLFYLELKRWIRSYTPVVPSKTILDSNLVPRSHSVLHWKVRSPFPLAVGDLGTRLTRFHTKLKWAKSTSVFRPKGRKNHTLWGGTYLYNLEYPSGEPEYQAFLGKRGTNKQISSLLTPEEGRNCLEHFTDILPIGWWRRIRFLRREGARF